MRRGAVFISRKNKVYVPKFKVEVVEDMRKNGLSQHETSRKYGITRSMVQRWERVYLETGAEGLCEEQRGRATGSKKGRQSLTRKSKKI